MIFSQTFRYSVQSSKIWEKEKIEPFNELIVSWNGFRPQKGKWAFWVSLKQGEWSPWLRYAEWGVKSQGTFKNTGSFIETLEDCAFPKEGKCNGFRIQVVAEEGADLTNLHSLFASASHLADREISPPGDLAPVLLPDVPRQSQMGLTHPRATHFCSPTSLSTALNFLLKKRTIDPVDLASKVYDGTFDIYGNWILNTAQAYQELRGTHPCHVERLGSFLDLYRFLQNGLPVVVSVRSPLPGAARFYPAGHLICVIGYEKEKVACIDPAFGEDGSTFVRYELVDFLAAWNRRNNIAYVFS